MNGSRLVYLDTLLNQARAHHRDKFAVVRPHNLEGFQHGDPGAETAVGLRHLKPDRTAANDDEMFGTLAQQEHGFIGQIVDRIEAGNRRYGGRRPGCDHEPARPHARAVRADDLARPGEPRRLPHHMNAQLFEPLDAVMGRDRGDDRVHMIVDLVERNAGRAAFDPKRSGTAIMGGGMGGGEQGFRWHAAIVEAIAPHLGALEQHRLCSHLRGPRGHRKAARASANDTQINVQGFNHNDTCPTKKGLARSGGRRLFAPALVFFVNHRKDRQDGKSDERRQILRFENCAQNRIVRIAGVN